MANKHIKYGFISFIKANAPSLQSRVFPRRLGIGAQLSAAIVSTLNDTPWESHSGNCGVSTSQMQVVIFGKKDLDVETAKSEIVNAAHCFKGTIGDVKDFSCFLDSEGELFDDNLMDLDEYGKTLEFEITWEL